MKRRFRVPSDRPEDHARVERCTECNAADLTAEASECQGQDASAKQLDVDGQSESIPEGRTTEVSKSRPRGMFRISRCIPEDGMSPGRSLSGKLAHRRGGNKMCFGIIVTILDPSSSVRYKGSQDY